MKHIEGPDHLNISLNHVLELDISKGSTMTNNPDDTGWGSAARSIFDGQLQTLMGVMGHEFGPNELRKVDIANCLGIDATGLSQRLSGRTKVSPQEYAKLIDKFGLSAKGIDFSIFEIQTRAAFLDVLRQNEVGTFDGTGASLLRRRLDLLTQRSKGISVTFRRAPVRGLEHPDHAAPKQQILRRGENVQLRIKSNQNGGRIGVFETQMASRLHFRILAPSVLTPDTALRSGRLNIPPSDDIERWLTVGGVPGPHRLFVLQAPGKVIDFLFKNDIAQQSGHALEFHSLSDERQRDLRNLITLEDKEMSATALDYVVV